MVITLTTSSVVLSCLSQKAPAAKLGELLGDVTCVCRVWRALCPSSVPLQPPIQVRAPLLIFRPLPQFPEVHLVHSQMQGPVHLWTQEERIQNTLQNTLAPRCGRKPRMELNTASQRLLHTSTNVFLFIMKYYHHKNNNQTASCYIILLFIFVSKTQSVKVLVKTSYNK